MHGHVDHAALLRSEEEVSATLAITVRCSAEVLIPDFVAQVSNALRDYNSNEVQ